MTYRLVLLLLVTAWSAVSQIQSSAVGHEYRQDDWPSIAASPDGSLWVAWLSFVGERDDLAIRHYRDGQWKNLQWVPNTSGDSWIPQAGVDAQNRVWIVWPQQVNGNWDIYARRYDADKQEWSALERLSTDPGSDSNPRLATDGNGKLAVVWQGFRGKNSNVFCRIMTGDKWGPEVRVTNRPANDWEPAAAFDSRGNVWVAYDSYKNGNYDVFMTELEAAQTPQPEITVVATPNFEARATVAVDTTDRVWVAWEEGEPNWGKDNGFVVRDTALGVGVPLGGVRRAMIRAHEGNKWMQPASALNKILPGQNSFQPHVFSDGHGSVWVAAKCHLKAAGGNANRGYWEYYLTHLDGNTWTKPVMIPDSRGRSSTRVSATVAKDGNFWLAWSTDQRKIEFSHRPIRQQVLAGSIPNTQATAVSLQPAVNERVSAQSGGHGDEAGDVRGIRAYTSDVDGKPMHIMRGDFHRHTELSWDGGGTNDGNLQDFYRYMIDVAAMDFGASTDHQGGGWPYWWWYTQKMTDMYHVPGAYVPIFGYERSAAWPFGHRNVFYAKRSDSRMVPFFLKEGVKQFSLPLGLMGDDPDPGTSDLAANDTRILYEEAKAHNGLVIPHTSATRMGTNWSDNDPSMEPVVEIFQGCRANSEQEGAPFDYAINAPNYAALRNQAGFFKEGYVSNAWAKGYKLGIITSSDHNATHISYAMVYTDDPTRQGILDAIRRRHTYGAMDNIILDVRMGDHFMGDEFQLSETQPIHVKARATKPVRTVEVIKDSKVVYTTQPAKRDVDFQFRDSNVGSGRHFYYVRLQQEDGMLAWSSPFFVNY
ncbi:MAG: hypothetical protein JOZ62_20885 [Acidobacteriaceae bacterium]|nr:hypothetical protein [Acidobacteriaceae bacterium]